MPRVLPDVDLMLVTLLRAELPAGTEVANRIAVRPLRA